MASSRRVAPHGATQRQSIKTGFAAAFHYTEPSRNITTPTENRRQSDGQPTSPYNTVSPRRRAAQLAGMNGYNASPDLPPPLYVRALYDYDADDQTSLSFKQGDIIHVLTQLESGWWDGVIDDVRGWFPSNYCTVLTSDDNGDTSGTLDESEASAESGTEEEYDEDNESDTNTNDEDSDLPIEGSRNQTQEEAAYWVPQATPDGRLFYFNTLTGVSTMELPLEKPTGPDETGPRERNNFFVPDQTRPPPELMAGGFERRASDYDGSASDADAEADGEHSFLSTGRKGSGSVSTSTSTASTKVDPRNMSFGGFLPTAGTTSTSYSIPPPGSVSKSAAPKYFSDDGIGPATTWSSLVEDMQISVGAYRQAIQDRQRADFVRCAEAISDHLRMLLAAGSGTTDNHSGNPSIISTNKALYPHFREMMSKFSKLVLSSHMAAADWPGQDNFAKCLQEADGVLNGVYGYVEVARQQRGEEIPRLVPGFVQGSKSGGNWRDNNIDHRTGVEGTSFIDESNEMHYRPSTTLDVNVLRQLEECRKPLVDGLKRLDGQLHLTEKIITALRQAALGDRICMAAGNVVDSFRPWISLVESIDLSSLGNSFKAPSLLEFGTQKQRVYDSIGELVACCQAVTLPLPDEWSEVRGDSLDVRLSNVRNSWKELEKHVSNVGYALELLVPSSTASKKDHRMTDGGETYQNTRLRNDLSSQRPQLGDIGQSNSYSVGEPTSDRMRRPPSKDKAARFFGTVPNHPAPRQTPQGEPGSPAEDTPWYLEIDHPGEVSYDQKNEPPQVKAGTLMGLVEQLTRHDRPDTTFNNIFLLTYRSFISAAELFEMLVGRFNIQPPAGLTREQFLTWQEQKQKPVRFRVANILKQWLESFWFENFDDESRGLLERIDAFNANNIADAQIPLTKPLAATIEQRKKGQGTSAKRLVLTLTNSAPPPVLPKNMKKLKLLDVDALETARQLTIMESKLYGKIKPIECLDKTWQKKGTVNGAEPAPNVKALILHSNQLTNWVAEMILVHPEVKKRVMVIKHFVGVADVSLPPQHRACQHKLTLPRDAALSTTFPPSSPSSPPWAHPPSSASPARGPKSTLKRTYCSNNSACSSPPPKTSANTAKLSAPLSHPASPSQASTSPTSSSLKTASLPSSRTQS